MKSTSNQQKSCLIIGGGISGLIAGTMLQRHGIKVTILDKGRGIGGRLATRRIPYKSNGQGIFDYGAQFFTVSEPKFQQWVDQWLEQGLVREWSKQLSNTETTCYCGIESNRSLAQHLAKDLNVHLQTRATKITWDASYWTVETEKGNSFHGDILIMTSPIPQSLALLENSDITLPPQIKSSLEQVTYYPCLTVLALLDQLSLIPEPGGLRLKDPSLAWIACNHKKGISPQGFAVTLHSTPEFSETHWNTEDSIVVEKLLEIASSWLGSNVVEYQLHRWLYSHPKTVYGELYLDLQQPGLLMMAGDAFSAIPALDLSLNVEKATLSALATANYLLKQVELN
ncbi:NAD(P)/FAD-dependent oxidoreductase [Crocosphaera sp. XPORK-15E]|uniref:NAD(P)/FAD-dependent oxidoreductase n=1 Tax=Crocosphaera sp. XPORK-15E TaxID=3110247 RepID=UPI002B2033CE|nr:FAD-dependent oxidoreductase [Crocosphaera sp. XPORK-15E]MEA5532770.1 FAD-dependent oxidoreductase [Crocosphaera sp. XPORK-15E]